MPNSDGLSIQDVQRQWEESQGVISELRQRLELLARASESAQASADSIKGAEEHLARLATDASTLVATTTDAVNKTLSVLTVIAENAKASDITNLAENLSRIEGEQLKLNEGLESIRSVIAAQAETLENLHAQQQGIDEAKQEILSRVRTTVASLPSRHQSKFSNL